MVPAIQEAEAEIVPPHSSLGDRVRLCLNNNNNNNNKKKEKGKKERERKKEEKEKIGTGFSLR